MRSVSDGYLEKVHLLKLSLVNVLILGCLMRYVFNLGLSLCATRLPATHCTVASVTQEAFH